MSSPPLALPTPPRSVPLEWNDVLSYDIHSHYQSESSPTDCSPTTDIGIFLDMAGRLRPSLPADCLWLGQEDAKVIGTHPIDAGGFADVWAGEMGDRKIAIKSYRCHASADYAQIYWVSNA